jgi:hypothetical protein
MGATTAHVPVVPEAALAAERRSLLHEIALLQRRVDELAEELARERVDKEQLMRELAAAERELEFWRSGRLKPE